MSMVEIVDKVPYCSIPYILYTQRYMVAIGLSIALQG